MSCGLQQFNMYSNKMFKAYGINHINCYIKYIVDKHDTS